MDGIVQPNTVTCFDVTMKILHCRLGRIVLLSTSVFTALTMNLVAIARDNGAGIGYSSSRDVSYCSTSLTAADRNARINVRHGPGTVYEAEHYGLFNDWVDILNENGNPNVWMSGEDNEGYSWYQIGFPASRAYGWVREDFLRFPPDECRN